MSTLRVFTALVSMGLVACVTQIEDLSDEERAELENDGAARTADDAIGVSQQALSEGDYDKTKADNLGNKARAGAPGTFKYCYRFVKRHLTSAGFTVPAELSGASYGGHAADFIKFASEKADKLRAMGLGHVSVARGEKYPLGTVVVYPRGACGYSPKSGHIEVVCDANGTRGCSDFNGRLGAVARPRCSGSQSFLPGGKASTSESCVDKQDGYYCSAVSPGAAYQCRNKSRGSALFCEGGTSSGTVCGTADQRANVADGKLTCSAASSTGFSGGGLSGSSTSDLPGTSDASPAVNQYLSGRTQNGVGGAQAHVTEVVADTPLVPVD